MYSMRETHRHWHLTKTSITISSPVLEKTSHFISSNIQQKWVLYGFIMVFLSEDQRIIHHCPVFQKTLSDFEELSRDLQGWNGRWKQKKARTAGGGNLIG